MEIPGRLDKVEDICTRADITPENVDEKINNMLQERMREGMW
jgi:hypothetical protein